jgi:NAD+ synthase (glutamine-hydrolysing)
MPEVSMMRVALAQINPVVGDLQGNAAKIEHFYSRALEADAQLVVYPELCLCGYPPEDLLYKKHFLQDNLSAVKALAAKCTQAAAVVGFPEPAADVCYNSAAVIENGQVSQIYRKGLLPNYGVFDESRYFSTGADVVTFELDGVKTVVTICRDIWDIDWLRGFLAKAQPFAVMVNLSSSPFHVGKIKIRQSVVSDCAKQFGCAICYCNTIGGQDELVFDGRSMIADSSGQVRAKAKAFEEDLLIADITVEGTDVKVTPAGAVASEVSEPVEAESALGEVYNALVLGTRDYVRKNGFGKVLVGLSGGIDSSVVAAIATAALGKENVTGITMPSRFNTNQTKSDAANLAKNLGIEFLTIPIEQTLQQFDKALSIVKGWDNEGVAYENLQARIRGSILMSLSNQFGSLVLTTGNKSETAVGYATLYGDTAGGFAVIKDVPKTVVYKLAEYINSKAGKQVIPQAVIERPPSAELKQDQKDSDSLPDYDLLDRILEGYVELDKSAQDLIESGLPKEEVLRTVRLVDKNEYKRRQSPPGVKITPKAFGKDRRLPITNQYKTK